MKQGRRRRGVRAPERKLGGARALAGGDLHVVTLRLSEEDRAAIQRLTGAALEELSVSFDDLVDLCDLVSD